MMIFVLFSVILHGSPCVLQNLIHFFQVPFLHTQGSHMSVVSSPLQKYYQAEPDPVMTVPAAITTLHHHWLGTDTVMF